LDSLAQHVRASRVFFLFLTNNIFSSPWCMMELVDADFAGAILVPILVEGSSWGAHGARKVWTTHHRFPQRAAISLLSTPVLLTLPFI